MKEMGFQVGVNFAGGSSWLLIPKFCRIAPE
jgi:hypothetical protein